MPVGLPSQPRTALCLWSTTPCTCTLVPPQVLRSLSFLHSLNLIHSDLKPENILIKSYSRCEVKVIDLGSSCFVTDRRSSYVQSRSYRAPEVVLGLPYGPAIDIWSLGCVMAELASGHVLFQVGMQRARCAVRTTVRATT